MMLNWKNVRLIFHREVRDQLRDRRTLFMITVLPLLLYPALGIGMVQLTLLFTEQPRTVVLLGARHLPELPLVRNSQFFSLPESEARKLEVITEDSPAAATDPKERSRIERLLGQAATVQGKLVEKEKLTGRSPDDIRRREAIQSEVAGLFAAGEFDVLVVIPSGFRDHLARVSRELAERAGPEGIKADGVEYPRPVIFYNRADEKSQIAYYGVKEAFDGWERQILGEQLAGAGLPATTPTPVNTRIENLALPSQLAAGMWSRMLPALLVVMAVTGAFYPAIDLGAGEKERGTMETLLICPASRTEIVLGKFFTVLCFSYATAVLNLLSLGLTGRHMASMFQRVGSSEPTAFAPPSLSAIIWILVLLIPLSSMFSSLCLSLATFARSSKEGQYYLTPILMVTLGLTMFCMSPGIELTRATPLYSVLPIANVALLLKGLLLHPEQSDLYLYAIPVLGSTFGYSILAQWWAIDQFQREDVLFREAERFDLGLWVRQIVRDKEDTPTFAEAGFCFVLIMLLQFAMLNALRNASLGPDGAFSFFGTIRGMLITQIAIVASPAMFMALILTKSVRATLRLRWPRLDWLLLAALLPLALHPLMLEFSEAIAWVFPNVQESVSRMGREMVDPRHPLIYVVLAFAIAPAICEELAFRGFLLSGFAHHGRTGLAIALSSIAFGIIHMIPLQVFNAALMGIVLGLIALRSGSLLPCITFHMIYNLLGIMHGRLSSAWQGHPPRNLFLVMEEGKLRYTTPTLMLATLVLAFGLWYLLRRPGRPSNDTPAADRHVLPQPETRALAAR